MLAIAAVGVIIAILLRTGGEMVRACLIAGLWFVPVLPVVVTWSLIDRLIIVSDRGAAAALSLLAGIVVFGGAMARRPDWRRPCLRAGRYRSGICRQCRKLIQRLLIVWQNHH